MRSVASSRAGEPGVRIGSSVRVTVVDGAEQGQGKAHPCPSKGNLSQSIIKSSFLYLDPCLFLGIRKGQRETMFAKPWNTTTSTNGDVVVTVVGFEASVKATVTRGGKHVTPSVRFRKRDDRGGREQQFTKEVLTTAEWPAAGPDEEKEWSAFLKAALTRMGNPSHLMEAAHECSSQWRGSLDMDALRKDGFVGATAVVQPSDAEILEAWGAELADEAGASTVHHLQGESGAHSVFVLPETWKAETLAEYGGKLARGWKVAPQRWVPRKVAVRRALAAAQPHMVVTGARGTGEPAFDVSGALERAAEALRVGCGKAAGGIKPLLEILVADEARLIKPQPWHADLLSIASLGAIAMLSERGVPPYFPAICKDWGDGRGVIASASEGSGKRKGKSQIQEISYYAARKMRWDRVYASGRERR